MAVVLGLVVILVVFVGIPMLCRMAIRRMAASQGLRGWINEYGPRLPFLESAETEDSVDGDDHTKTPARAAEPER